MTRCSVCDHSCRLVPPDGPEPCDFLFIGEKPGQQEDKGGRPFIGDSGREFNENYLALAGLNRSSIRITNTVKCRLGGNNNKPTPEQVRACSSHHLPNELATGDPSIIVLMGSTACSLVPDIELDKEHGIPRWINEEDSDVLNWSGWVVPMFHPAAGLHDTGTMIPLLEDFSRLRKWLAGKWSPPRREYEPDYQIAGAVEIARLLRESKDIGLDTEDDGGKPWSIQCAVSLGKSRLVRVEDEKALSVLRRVLPTKKVIMHNAPHDLGVLEQLGIYVTDWRDTMQEAYHLGNLPQGLKALAYRLLGIRMRSWLDLVEPPSRARMMDYLYQAWNEASERRIRSEKQLKTKLKVSYKPNPAEKDLKRILSHSHKPDYDIWKRYLESKLKWEPEWTGELGPHPIRSIANVDLKDAVEYACQDADVTLQVAGALANLRKEVTNGEWAVWEEDWDK